MTKRRKYYFMDYTKLVAQAKKIKAFLDKNRDQCGEFHYKNLGKFLRKKFYNGPIAVQKSGEKATYLRSSLINNQALVTNRKCFVILRDLGFIKSFEFELVAKQDSYIIRVEFGSEQRPFDEVVKQSEYFPLAGEKQQLTDGLRATIKSEYLIDYAQIMSRVSALDYADIAAYLTDVLPDLWHKKYQAMTPDETFIQTMSRDFTLAFDVQSHNPYQTDDDFIEDRVVVFYGLSKKSEVKRDSTRLAGYLRGVYGWTDKDTDKGHFIGHSLGGGVDENIFPQKKEVNRGHSVGGKVYRAMETYCAQNEGTFCFSRPIYCDFSTRPFVLEYGVLKRYGTLWVEAFENV